MNFSSRFVFSRDFLEIGEKRHRKKNIRVLFLRTKRKPFDFSNIFSRPMNRNFNDSQRNDGQSSFFDSFRREKSFRLETTRKFDFSWRRHILSSFFLSEQFFDKSLFHHRPSNCKQKYRSSYQRIRRADRIPKSIRLMKIFDIFTRKFESEFLLKIKTGCRWIFQPN